MVQIEICGPQGKYDLLDLKPTDAGAHTTGWTNQYKADPYNLNPMLPDEYEINSGEILSPNYS